MVKKLQNCGLNIMNDKEIKEKISRFSGNLQAAFALAEVLCTKYGVEFDINFDSSPAFQKFTNMVRNLISKDVISRPMKSGRSLIFDEKTFLQIIVARKYILSGISMENLSGYISELSINELYTRISAERLTDIDTVAGRSNRSSSSFIDSDQIVNYYSDSLPANRSELYRYIKIGTGFYLHIQEGRLSIGDIEEIKEAIRTKLTEINKLKKQSE